MVRCLLALVCAVALSSCGGRSGAAANARKPTTHTVTMDGVRFDPETVTLSPGDSVIWVNKDPFPHNVKSGTAFESKPINPGESWRQAFDSPGEFAYACTLHPTMKGVVRARANGGVGENGSRNGATEPTE